MDEESFINLLGVDYKREGGLFKICCPFHHDTHPSLVVYPQDRGYCCYPCGRTGSWQELYKEIKGCEWREAYEVLGIEGEYHQEKKPAIRFEFVDGEDDKFIDAVNERYNKCLPLDDTPAVAFLEKKHLLKEATEQGWRWDEGNFVQSKPRGALIIPYREDGKIVTCRLRTLEEDGSISKPKSLKGTHSRPYVLAREGKDLYICEGETDALSLWSLGYSVVAVPGAMQKKCVNTAVLYGEITGAKRIISCGDNDGPGKAMNDQAQKAAHALTPCEFEILPPESMGGLNDINDAFVAGVLRIDQPIELPQGAQPLHGWEAVFAKAVFSDKEEIYQLVTDEISAHPISDAEELEFVSSLVADSMDALKKAWANGKVEFQRKYEYLKDTMKLALEAPVENLIQSSLLGKQNYGS